MIVGTYDCRVWYMYSLNISAWANAVFWHNIKVNNKLKPYCED